MTPDTLPQPEPSQPSLLEKRNRDLERRQRALHEASLVLNSEHSLELLLQKIVDLSRDLAEAKYGALAVHDSSGAVLQFITAGITPWERAALGPPPRGRGLLGVIIREGRSLRVSKIGDDPRSVGFPPGHPPMETLLGVPVVFQGRVLGNLYVTEKLDGGDFTDDDELSLKMLGQMAAIAIENARLIGEMQRRATESYFLYEIGKTLNSSLSLNAILETIALASANVLEADKVVLRVLDETSGTLSCRVARGFTRLTPEQLTARTGEGIVGRVAATGQAIVVQDTANEPGIDRRVIELEGIGSLAHVPIKIAGAVYGVFSINYTQPGAVPPDALTVLQALADQAGIAIQNARLFAELERRAAEANFLYETGKNINSSLSLDDILETIVNGAATVLKADRVLLRVLDRAAGVFRARHLRGFNGMDPGAATVPADRGAIGLVVATGQPAVVQDDAGAGDAHRWLLPDYPVGSFAHVPIQVGGELYGVFTLAYRQPHAVPPHALTITQALADQAAIAIQNSQLYAAVLTERNALESVFNSLSDGVYTLGLDRRIQRLNNVAIAATGLPAEAVAGRPCWEVFHYFDEAGRNVCETSCPILGFYQHNHLSPPREVYLHTGEGERIPVALTASPIRDASGRVTGMVEVFRDMSHQREVDEMKSNLVSMVSHELRTPLSHIKGYVSTLLQPDVEWDAETQRDFLESVERQADRLAKLVGDLLDMSRLEAGQQSHPEPTPAATLAQGGVRMIASFLREHDLRVELPETLPWVLADAPQIERVLANLLENAAKYSPKGTPIVLSAAPLHGELAFAVADRGIGIPPEEQERIFEKFYRVVASDVRAPGTGLGLAICKGIVTAHNGRIWAESNPGGGTVFRFTLPLARPEATRER